MNFFFGMIKNQDLDIISLLNVKDNIQYIRQINLLLRIQVDFNGQTLVFIYTELFFKNIKNSITITYLKKYYFFNFF